MGNLFCIPKTKELQWKQKLERDFQLLKRNDGVSLLISFPRGISVDDEVFDAFYVMGQSLNGNTRLVQLGLRNVVLNEAVACSLGEGIGKSGLTDLWFDGPIQAIPELESSEYVNHTFCDGLATSKTLRKAQFLYFDSEGALIIARIVRKVHTFNTMIIYESLLGNDGITHVALSLRHNTSLTSLELYGCDVDDKGAGLLANAIHRGLPIQSLILNRTFIGVVGVKCLMQTVTDHPTLQKLDLSSNRAIGYEGLRIVGEFIEASRNQTFSQLEVHDCARLIGYDDIEDFASKTTQERHTAQRLAGQALLNGIKRNNHLRGLGIVCNGFYWDLREEISFYAQLNRAGRNLLSSGQHASTIWCHVLSKCQHEGRNVTSIMYCFLREQPHLVCLKNVPC